MRVTIDLEVLNDATAWDTLDQIVVEFLFGRHIWDIPDPEMTGTSGWITSDVHGRAGKRNILVMQKTFTESVYYPKTEGRHSVGIRVMKVPAGPGDATAAAALECLREPVVVLVENVESDGAFLEAIADALGHIKLVTARHNRWLTIDQMGGYGEVEKRIVQFMRSRKTHLRVFVLADSDALYPAHVTATMTKVEGSCALHSVPFAILKKRKIENYLPVEALQGKKRQVFQAYLELTEVQKDYYDLKKGFEVEGGRTVIPDEQRLLFAKVRKAVLDNLRGGFGKHISNLFREARHHITEQTLARRCQAEPMELSNILDEIERLL